VPQLPITNVVNVSVSAAQTGLGAYNVNNLALFTTETYDTSTFGTQGFAIYLDPTQVGIDFGTDNGNTYFMANIAFSQQPNMLAGGGYLAVIPMYTLTQTFTPSDGPSTGAFNLNYGPSHIVVSYDETASAIQTALQAIITPLTPGVTVAVAGTLSDGDPLVFTFSSGTVTLPLTITANTTSVTYVYTATHETLAAAIARTTGLVQYFGIMSTYLLSESELLAAAAVIQPLNKIGFFVSNNIADTHSDGKLQLLTEQGFTKSRGLFYGASAENDDAALAFLAAYAGRALSTNFDGSNTTSTMHLKNLVGIAGDLYLTQTYLDFCTAGGIDTYPSLQGVAKVFCSGANNYFDQVYNLGWFVGALQVAGFNYLAQSQTKVPQTEPGMTGLKGAYRAVCQQAVANAYLAPGQWNSSTTFGNQADFLANISNAGYYMYSQPVSQQSQANREARQAPLVQIAAKEAGAIQSSDLIIYVNP
jgi:hypothetical protein